MPHWETWKVLRVPNNAVNGIKGASLAEVAAADLVLTESGQILKDRHGIRKLIGDK